MVWGYTVTFFFKKNVTIVVFDYICSYIFNSKKDNCTTMENKIEVHKVDLRKNVGTLENPFYKELNGKMFVRPKVNTVIAKGQQIINKETQEIVEDRVVMGKRIFVDKSQFAKIYVTEIADLINLSKKALNVLLYIMKKMDYEQKIFISKAVVKDVGYKAYTPVLDGIKELIGNNVIAPAIMPGYYWINPVYVCKGERFAKYTEYVQINDDHKANDVANSMIKNQVVETFDAVSHLFQDKNPFKDEFIENASKNNSQTNILDQIKELENN